MKKLVFILAAILASHAAEAQTRQDYDSAAAKFQRYYNTNKPEALYKLFSPRVKNTMTLNDTKGMFFQMKKEQGKMKSCTYIKQDDRFTFYKLTYEKSVMALAMTLNEDKTMQSFRVMGYNNDDAGLR